MQCIHDAVTGNGTDEMMLLDALIGATPGVVEWIRKLWKQKHPLIGVDTRIKLETRGDLQRILEAILDNKRPESGIDAATVDADLEELHKATEGKIGTHEAKICSIIASRSREHLQHLNQKYKEKYGKEFTNVLEWETSGIMELAFCGSFLPG